MSTPPTLLRSMALLYIYLTCHVQRDPDIWRFKWRWYNRTLVVVCCFDADAASLHVARWLLIAVNQSRCRLSIRSRYAPRFSVTFVPRDQVYKLHAVMVDHADSVHYTAESGERRIGIHSHLKIHNDPTDPRYVQGEPHLSLHSGIYPDPRGVITPWFLCNTP